MITGRRRGMLQAGWLAVLLLLPSVAGAQAAADAVSAQLREVAVVQQGDSTIVQIKTSGAAKYRAEFMDSPNRLVLDLEDTLYAWRKMPLNVSQDPLKQIRGSQYRKGVARIVMEFTRKVGYAIREDADGLAITIPSAGGPEPSGTGSMALPATPPETPTASTARAGTSGPQDTRPG